MRPRIVLPLAAAAGVLALAAQFLILSPALPARGEYFLTELARGQVGVVSIPLMLGLAFAFGSYTRTSAVLVGLAMVLVFPAIALYEAVQYRGSHNLIPFEFAIIAIAAIPLMLTAWFGQKARAARDPSPDA